MHRAASCPHIPPARSGAGGGSGVAMTAVILVIHVLIALAMIVIVLLQRSDGGALGGLGGGTFGGVMSGRQSANLLTRATAVLAGSFMLTSMVLAILASGAGTPRSVTDDIEHEHRPAADSVLPAPPEEPEGGPQVPVGE